MEEDRNMEDLKTLWKETKEFVKEQEGRIAEKYIDFLRKVAEITLNAENECFSRENRVVHYGEGGFGWMIIEAQEDPHQVFGGYVGWWVLLMILSQIQAEMGRRVMNSMRLSTAIHCDVGVWLNPRR